MSSPEEYQRWSHKERLLQYDRDGAQRTVIYDDQADYYSHEMSTWMTAGERQGAEEREIEREEREHHQRGKLKLSFL